MEQQIGHARLSDGTGVGYAVAGTGPPLVWTPGWVSHLEPPIVQPLIAGTPTNESSC